MESSRRFLVHECLGKGGFGEVYRATQRNPGGLETVVALKLLRPDLALDEDAVRRLRDEARMLAQLDHPSILRVHDLTRLEGRVTLVAEYVEGVDFSAVVGAGFPPRALMEAASAVAGALATAWQALRVVHRDIKPSNVRIGRHGEVRLLDFGIARTDAFEREACTESDLVVGSVPYLAPERFTARSVRPASDVFALGCTLFEVLVGERFYHRCLLRQISAMAVERERFEAFLRDRLARLAGHPPEVVALVGDLLAFEPDARPDVSNVVARSEALAASLPGDGLRAWARGHPGVFTLARPHGELEGRVLVDSGDVERSVVSRPAPPVGIPGASGARRWAVAAAVAGGGLVAVVVALAAALAWVYTRPDGSRTRPEPQSISFLPSAPEPSPRVNEAAATGAGASSVAPSVRVRSLPRPPAVSVPSAETAVVPPAFGRVVVHAAMPAELRAGERRWSVPAEVPEGMYQLYVDSGDGLAPAANLTVVVGEVLELGCGGAPVRCAPR
jgi:hypothetical protein